MFNFIKKMFHVEQKQKVDMTIYEYEFLARIFSLDEAKKHLLNVVPPLTPGPDEVLKDSQAVEAMMRNHGWFIFERAIWFKLLTALRQSLSAQTIEEREGARNRVLAHLHTLHLPYEMRQSGDGIRKMKELEEARKATAV